MKTSRNFTSDMSPSRARASRRNQLVLPDRSPHTHTLRRPGNFYRRRNSAPEKCSKISLPPAKLAQRTRGSLFYFYFLSSSFNLYTGTSGMAARFSNLFINLFISAIVLERLTGFLLWKRKIFYAYNIQYLIFNFFF